MHHIIDYAKAGWHDNMMDRWVANLPQVGADDYDFERIREIALEDWDVLMLFDSNLAGIQDPGNMAGQFLGVANLQFDDWFKPFRAHSIPADQAA